MLGGLYGLFGPHLDYAIAGTVVAILAMGFMGAPFWLWTAVGAVACVGFEAPEWLLGVYVAVAVIGNITPLRRTLLSSIVMKILAPIMPAISDTEREALEAGNVGVEGELFSGRPDLQKLATESYPKLTPEEQKFIDVQVETLCSLVDDNKLWKERELPQQAWDYMRKEKFLGMIIPREYGGLGFSATAHSEVIMKLSSRSVATAITVMVPNSLGPAELLNHYGTEEQKRHYLPKLATGEEVPCFALTEPTAGSDAGSITAEGTLFRGQDGKLMMKLNWNKRWITLAAISTTLGLAFRLRDPENLLGKGEDVGITCALIPSKTPGVVIGRRHDPLGTPFYNCPTQGKDVVVSVDAIVGGVAMAGKGWKMLMECLAAGRGISLPAQSTGGAKLVARAVSNHAVIRKQFGVSIGKFEGVEEPLARIAGNTYAIEAMRRYTTGALDKGMKPGVVTAMAKYNATEMSRKMINDGMDVMGGQGISLGSRNLLGHLYIATPIGITVEGANIMTRTLIIFGQGAMRAHPYAFKEVDAIGRGDLKAFDKAFWGHVGHVVRNLFRSVLLSLTRGYLASTPSAGPVTKHYRKLAWSSATFAIMADMAMGTLGGSLKMAEKVTGRFADILSWMYIGTAVLRRWEAEGRKVEDLPLVDYAMETAFAEIQKAFDGLFANFKVPLLSWVFSGPLLWWSKLNSFSNMPSDQLVHKVADILMSEGEQRDRLTEGLYIPKDAEQALGRQEVTFTAIKRAEKIDRKVRAAVRAKTIPKARGNKLYASALEKGVITKEEHQDLMRAEDLRYQTIQVDDFSQEEYHGRSQVAGGSEKRFAVVGK